MTAPVHALRPDQPADAPDAPGVAFSAWDYGHALARSQTAAKVGTGAYVVLHAIASHANKQAQAEVGHARIAEECGLSRAMVKRHIATLVACNALGVHRRRDDDAGLWETNLYTILPLKEIKKAHPVARDRSGKRAIAGGGVRNDPSRVFASPRVFADPTLGDANTLPPGVPNYPTLGNANSPKASPLSIPSISIPMKHPFCALGEPSAPAAQDEEEHAMTDQELATEQALLDAKAPAAGKNGTGKSRRKPMTEEEKQAVKSALARFNERLRPIVDEEYGRFVRETLGGIRGFGLDHFLATVDLMATNPRFVDDPHVTPVLVTKTVPIWEDNGKPRSWTALEERKKRRMQNGRH